MVAIDFRFVDVVMHRHDDLAMEGWSIVAIVLVFVGG